MIDKSLMEKAKQVEADIKGLLETAEKYRATPRLSGINWPAIWQYCYQMAFNPYQDNYNMRLIREEGKVKKITDDSRLHISLNKINERLLDMVSKETSQPIDPDVVYIGTEPLRQLTGEFDQQNNPLFDELQPDQVVDRVKAVLRDAAEKMGLQTLREQKCLGRRVFGRMAFLLDWDDEAGEGLTIQQVRTDEEKWSVVHGQFEKDGQFVRVPVNQLPLEWRNSNPEAAASGFGLFGEEDYRAETLTEGLPTLELLYPWQFYPIGNTSNYEAVPGWLIVDYLPESEAKRLYSTASFYGDKWTIDWDGPEAPETTSVPTYEKGQLRDLAFMDYPDGTKLYKRVRYLRRRQGTEQKHQRLAMIGGKLVRGNPSRYGPSFEKSMGIYVFWDRLLAGSLDAVPTTLFMTAANTLINDMVSFKHELIDQMITNKWLAVAGDPDAVKVGVAEGSEPGVVVSTHPLTEFRSGDPPQTLDFFINQMEMHIQGFAADQFIPGSRKEDLPTLGQSQMLERTNQSKIGYYVERDAREYTKLYTDLVELLRDRELNRDQRITEIEERIEAPLGSYTQARRIPWDSQLFKNIGQVRVGTKALVRATEDEQLQKIFLILRNIPLPAAQGAPDPYAEARSQLVKRMFELVDLPGVSIPPDLLQLAAAQGAAMPQLPGKINATGGVNSGASQQT